MANPRSALGFRVHTGWAAAVVLGGKPGDLRVFLRQRIDLLPEGGTVSRFVYHAAAELDPGEAAGLVKSARAAADKSAEKALEGILNLLRTQGVAVRVAAVPTGSTVVPADLTAILRSHPLIHSAEGALFQQTLVSACKSAGLKVATIREREVWHEAARACGLTPSSLEAQVTALRQSAGAPWGQDQKIAAAAALCSGFFA